jgi:hypothetical protein
MKTIKLFIAKNQILTFDNQEQFKNYNWENFDITGEVFIEGMESKQPLYLEFETPTEVILSTIKNLM